MPDVNIRRATLADVCLLAELNKDVQQIHADAYPNVFKQPDNFTEIVADFETRILADVDGFVFIIEAETQAVGYIYARLVTRPENAYIYAQRFMLVDQVSVRPACQNKGYGQRLMQAVREVAAEHGVHRIQLDTYAFNANAQQFYANLGFERVSVRLALDF
jgi:diamine N-acetyltransferase